MAYQNTTYTKIATVVEPVTQLKLHDLNIQSISDLILNTFGKNEFDYITTPNVDHILRIHKHNYLSEIYSNSSLCLCDSKILKLLMRLKGIKVENVVPGSDLTEHLFSQGLLTNHKVLIIGSSERDVMYLKRIYNLNKIDVYTPPMGFIHRKNEIAKTIDNVQSKKPDIIFLALGSPQQEILAEKLSASPNIKGVALCIGASIDFLSGKQKRAPKIFRHLYMEWLFRVLTNPIKLSKRYASNMKIFFYYLLK